MTFCALIFVTDPPQYLNDGILQFVIGCVLSASVFRSMHVESGMCICREKHTQGLTRTKE